jgi:purine-nucleoside phosphorylase
MNDNLLKRIRQSVEFIKKRTDIKPQIGLTLGSGLAAFADQLQDATAIPYNEIPHFVPPSVEGHPGQMVLGTVGDVPVVVLRGRIHFYEGHSLDQVVYPTRVMAQLGIQKLILTNAAGGLDPCMRPGDFMVIDDHINLTGTNPLIGPNIAELGLRFPDMTEAYDRALCERALKVFSDLKIRHSRGVYCGVSGPTYETAAEVRYLQLIGGHAVGMSTVPETIAAKHMGLRVCGVSCISNLATGISSSPITHDEVKETTARVEHDFARFLSQFIAEASL